VAVVAAAPAAADALRRVWDSGRAAAVIDPDPHGLDARLAALAPTHVLDETGERPRAGGRGVPAGTGAVVRTSGTTGAPRHVLLDHAALTASADRVHAALGLDASTDRWLACLPLHHVAGLAIVARAHRHGVPLTVLPRFDVDAVVQVAEGATVSLVPTTLHRLLAARPDAIARFRRVVVGGGALAPALAAATADVGGVVTTTYGLTETGGGCVHDGHPLPDVEVTLAPGTDEVLVRGPVILRGYRDTATTPLDAHGRFATGDVGRWNDDGTLAIIDRRKDIVKSGGVNVSPTRVEQALIGAPDVADVAVVGVPDPEWGERVVACLVPSAGTLPELAALRAHGRRAGLSAAELPREMRVVGAIPRTAGGKVRRRELRDASA
jgi:O-succinylbenzoic acid--CoA ligase